MSDERIRQIIENYLAWQSGRYSRFAPILENYLRGNSRLNEFKREWEATVPSELRGSFYFHPIIASFTKTMDELDRKLIDVCLAAGKLSLLLGRIGTNEAAVLVYDYLLKHSVDLETLAGIAVSLQQGLLEDDNQPRPLGKWVLQQSLSETFWREVQIPSHRSLRAEVMTLLLSATPPRRELAWLVGVQATEYSLGECVPLMMDVDPHRAAPYAQRVAEGKIFDEKTRANALERLITFDHSFDTLALQIYNTAGEDSPDGVLRCTALRCLFACAPDKYRNLLEEACISKARHLALEAARLTSTRELTWSQDLLKGCVYEGPPEAALASLERLLREHWGQREEFVLSLLSHRLKTIRESTAAWLSDRKDISIDQLKPYLTAKDVDCRISAIAAIPEHPAPEILALLNERLLIEKSEKVKIAILHRLKASGTAAKSEDSILQRISNVIAKAENIRLHLKKSVLNWFDSFSDYGIRWITGEQMTPEVIQYVLHTQMGAPEGEMDPTLGGMLDLVDRTSSGNFARSLFRGWAQQNAPAKEAWCFPLCIALGDDQLARPLRTEVDFWTRKNRKPLAVHGVRMLGRLQGELALGELDDLSEKNKSSNIRELANKVLEEIAIARNTTRQELTDNILSGLGFDSLGQRILDFGPRHFKVRIMPGLVLAIFDSEGKKLKELPKQNSNDDPVKSRGAATDWKSLKVQHKHATARISQSLERAIIEQRVWRSAQWRTLFVEHPVGRSVASTLVWGILAQSGRGYSQLFRPIEEGVLSDCNDQTIVLPDNADTRLAHPLDFDPETLEKWRLHLSDYEVMPFVAQLDRPVYRVDDSHAIAREWKGLSGREVRGSAFTAVSIRAGWRHCAVGDGGMYYGVVRTFSKSSIAAVLSFEGIPIYSDPSWTTKLNDLYFVGIDQNSASDLESSEDTLHTKAMVLSEVPPIIFSETVRQASILAGSSRKKA